MFVTLLLNLKTYKTGDRPTIGVRHRNNDRFVCDSCAGGRLGDQTPRERRTPNPERRTRLPAKNPSEDQGRNYGRIRLNNIFGRFQRKLAPGDFFVGNRARIRSIARGRIADLTEIAPSRDMFPPQILVKHRNDAYWEIACNAAGNLEKADR